MRRDHEEIRAILFEAEKWPKGYCPVPIARPDGDRNSDRKKLDVREHHIRLMEDQGLLVVRKAEPDDRLGNRYMYRLSSSGHDYLDRIREPDRWSAVKRIACRFGDAGLDIMIEVAANEARRVIGLSSA